MQVADQYEGNSGNTPVHNYLADHFALWQKNAHNEPSSL